jgi:hypothetical protein
MLALIHMIGQSTIRVVESPGTAEAAANNAAETTARAAETTHHFISIGDPLALTLWIVAVLLTMAVWHQLSKPAYYPRRYEDIGKGPLTRLRHRLSQTFNVFLS